MPELFDPQPLNERPVRKGRFVLYWMQAAQRGTWNPALEHTIRMANQLHVPPLTLFVVVPDYPEANARHYRFFLEGLRGVTAELERRGVASALRTGDPTKLVPAAAAEACALVMDVGYTRIQRQWRDRVAARCPCRAEAVETEAIVPTTLASAKQEWSAATLRRRLLPLLERFLTAPVVGTPRYVGPQAPPGEHHALLADDLAFPHRRSPGACDGQVTSVERHYAGGFTHARRRLDQFLDEVLPAYGMQRGDPSVDACSHLSPYLHFGQISPLEVALRAVETGESVGESAFLEELIVRRGLSANYALHNPAYDRYEGLPEWARRSLDGRRADPRSHLYSLADLEEGATHDPLWNAAMREMRQTGWLHNTMRMYWGKKILEWSPSPEEAFERALFLNNRWFLDGRDPNSSAGVAWCFGAHDRPWPPRPVFGTVRAMTEGGLRRKYDMEAYLRRAGDLA